MAKPDNLRVLADISNNIAYVDTGKASVYTKVFKQGSGTLAAGTATITDSSALTTSKIFVTNTANENDLAVTTKSNGSFVVDGNGQTDTFDYLIVNL